jgi:4-amino-4-deoxy-L-arabinose transferase-like glycosyltransferase
VICFSLSAWILYRLAYSLYDKKTAGVTLLIFLAMPAVQMGYMLATPDAPQVLFWTLALYASYRAIFDDDKAAYFATGAFIGLGLLSKYTAILFPASLLAFVLLRRMRILATWPTWAAAVVALLVFSPVLIWNVQHDWISFGFQYHHGSSRDSTLQLGKLFEFLGGLFGVFSPVFFALLLIAIVAMFRHRLDDKSLFVALFTVVPLLFFIYKGLYMKMQLNWVAMAFLTGTLIVADFVVRQRLYKTLWIGLALAVVLDVAIKFPLALPLPPAWNILHRLEGFREASLALLRYRQPGDALYGDHLTTASILAFYAPDHPDATVPTKSRFSQYDLWKREGLAPNGPGLYLATEKRDKELKAACHKSRLLETYVYHFEDAGSKTFYLYRCDTTESAT